MTEARGHDAKDRRRRGDDFGTDAVAGEQENRCFHAESIRVIVSWIDSGIPQARLSRARTVCSPRSERRYTPCPYPTSAGVAVKSWDVDDEDAGGRRPRSLATTSARSRSLTTFSRSAMAMIAQ